MMKFFFALFISLAYAAKFPGPKGRIIKKASTSRLDQLNSDVFYCIMSFLSAKEVLNLRFLSQGVYHRIKELWPKMELSTIIEDFHSVRPVDFSHIVEIRKMNLKGIEGQMFPYNRAQLSCLRDFLFEGESIRNFQAVIDLLPRDSLTSLTLGNIDFTCSLISKIDFPKLICLILYGDICLDCEVFDLLPKSMRVLKLRGIRMDAIKPSSLAMALATMDKLEVLSLEGGLFYENSISTILENLPISLKRLIISCISLSGFEKKSNESSFKRLGKMTFLQEIDFSGTGDEFTIGIISNLPKCITNIICRINEETIKAFKQRSSEFKNVRMVGLYLVDTKLYPVIREIFPNLDENIKKVLNRAQILMT